MTAGDGVGAGAASRRIISERVREISQSWRQVEDFKLLQAAVRQWTDRHARSESESARRAEADRGGVDDSSREALSPRALVRYLRERY